LSSGRIDENYSDVVARLKEALYITAVCRRNPSILLFISISNSVAQEEIVRKSV
jgi:hypothetical protein